MGQLHEVLAVRDDAENIFKKSVQEAIGTFGKADRFNGSIRTLEMFDDAENLKIGGEIERKAITITVSDKLDYVSEATIRFIDILFQQDKTNQKAVADVVVDDKTIIPRRYIYLGRL